MADIYPTASDYEALQGRLLAALREDPLVCAVLLTGSRARGEADAWSDLDLGVVVNDGASAPVLERCKDAMAPLAHSTTIARGPVIILSVLTSEALRADVLIEPISIATKRPQPSHQVLFGPGELTGSLQSAPGPPQMDPAAVVNEFLRVLALLDVVIGRQEYFVGMQGVMLLRDHLVDLFYIENGRDRNRSRKRINDQLTGEQRDLLHRQPALLQERRAVIDGHRAAAEA